MLRMSNLDILNEPSQSNSNDSDDEESDSIEGDDDEEESKQSDDGSSSEFSNPLSSPSTEKGSESAYRR